VARYGEKKAVFFKGKEGAGDSQMVLKSQGTQNGGGVKYRGKQIMRGKDRAALLLSNQVDINMFSNKKINGPKTVIMNHASDC